VSRRTASIIELGAERWVVIADGQGNEKHFVHIVGRDSYRKVYRDLCAEEVRRATVDSQMLTDPFDTLEVQR
jgi:hypothetical protein